MLLVAEGIFLKVGFDRQQEAQVPVHDAPHNPSGAFMPNPAVAEFVSSLAGESSGKKKKRSEKKERRVMS